MSPMMFASSRKMLLACAVSFACLLLLPAIGQAQWIDAGGMANQMHQHDLLRDQTLRDPPDDDDVDEDGKSLAPSVRGDPDQAAMKAEMQRMIELRRQEFLPEYERRVRADGRQNADQWLRQVATEAGRRDGVAIRRKYGH
ncbi:MAG TPA: hypothetical protein PK743_06640 [Luteimonas sp.]|nr:hypothetical protein [Luteimonas sp.]HRP72292.1 hypothetical protein [Luteimonas sp.]